MTETTYAMPPRPIALDVTEETFQRLRTDAQERVTSFAEGRNTQTQMFRILECRNEPIGCINDPNHPDDHKPLFLDLETQARNISAVTPVGMDINELGEKRYWYVTDYPGIYMRYTYRNVDGEW